jgi:protein involved in ribonucleotide reduction
MLIAYDSRTGNVARFIAKLDKQAVRIDEDAVLQEPFVLVTYTTGFGKIPEKTAAFLKRNSRWLRGVAASGNRNWGEGFAKSADLIADQYRVPVLAKFELSGTSKEVGLFLNEMEEIGARSGRAISRAAL